MLQNEDVTEIEITFADYLAEVGVINILQVNDIFSSAFIPF